MKDKAEIELIPSQKGILPPTLLKFENGVLGQQHNSKIEFCRTKNKVTKESGALVVANNNFYTGNVSKGDANDLTDLYICVRNKTTNKIRIMPIEQVCLKNELYKKLNPIPIPDLGNKQNMDQLLLKQYSGRKGSRYVNELEKMKLNMTVVQNDLDTIVSNTSIIEPEMNPTDAENRRVFICPPFNKDAKKLQDVYNITDLIPDELLNRLEEEANVVYKTNVNILPITSEYLRNRLDELQKMDANEEVMLHIKFILYMDCLLNTIKQKPGSFKKVEISKISEKIENHVKTNFSDPNCLYVRSNVSKEKAICYFIVLALLMNEKYEVDINVFITEFQTNRAIINKFLNIVNAICVPFTNLVRLNLPSKVKPQVTRKFKRNLN